MYPMPCGFWKMIVSMKHKMVCCELISHCTVLIGIAQLHGNQSSSLCTALNQAGRQSEAIGLLKQLASNAVVECRCVFLVSETLV